jgi:hypothetical protein
MTQFSPIWVNGCTGLYISVSVLHGLLSGPQADSHAMPQTLHQMNADNDKIATTKTLQSPVFQPVVLVASDDGSTPHQRGSTCTIWCAVGVYAVHQATLTCALIFISPLSVLGFKGSE